jgi:hypothetical protein
MFTPFFNGTVNVCEYLNGTLTHPALKPFLTQLIEAYSEKLLHPCPYFGELEAYNITYNFPSYFYIGSYRVFWQYFDDEDDHIFSFRYGFRINNKRQSRKNGSKNRNGEMFVNNTFV